MQEIQIPLPRDTHISRVIGTIEETVVSSGLRVTLKATLGKYPGSIHWHVKNGNDKGVFEITLWPKQHRAWFSIQDGRKAGWIRPKIALLNRQFVESLNS